jgi:hypothetical protein
MTPADRTVTIWRADVARWHSNPNRQLRQSGDTTHAHAARCAMLLWDLHPNPSAVLLAACLHHDVAETETGDVPYGAKQKWSDLADQLRQAEVDVYCMMNLPWLATSEDAEWIKFVDRLDALLWVNDVCHMELTSSEWQKCIKWIRDKSRQLDIESRVDDILRQVNIH